jgi:hypothetical protein
VVSRVQDFGDSGVLKEYVDDGHNYVIHSEDKSSLVLLRERSEDDTSVGAFILRDESVMEWIRMIASSNYVEVREEKSTQRDLTNYRETRRVNAVEVRNR